MIYSPSKTEAYDVCALKGKLMYTDHWEPKEANNGTMGKISGAAFAKGAEYIHNGHPDYLVVSDTYFDQSVAHYVAYGVSFSMDVPKAKAILLKTLERYAKEHPFTTWKQVTGIEVELPDYGHCRMDVVGRDPEGYMAIADNKYKRQLKPEYVNKTLSEYRDSWQFQHYPWAYNQAYRAQQIQRIWVVLVIAEPFKIHSVPFFVNTVLQKRWLQSAEQKWADISAYESGNRLPVMATTHRDNYGDCPMKEACLEMDLDPQLMQFKYTKVPRMIDKAS